MPQPNSRPKSIPVPPRPPQPLPQWKLWESLAINIGNVPKQVTTLDLWRAFKDEGNVHSIDIFEDVHGNRNTRAKLRFRPPPAKDFWLQKPKRIIQCEGKPVTILISLDNKPPEWDVPSPVRPGVKLPAEIKIPITSMDIGILVDETTMMPMRTVGGGQTTSWNASLVLNLRRKDLFVYFELPMPNATRRPSSQEYRLRVPFSQLDRFFQTQHPSTGVISHFTFLESPPIYHRRIQNTENTFIEETSWRETDTWFRQAQIVLNPLELANLPVNLRRQNPIIDIGRWNAFRINYPKNCDENGRFSSFCGILSDYNLVVEKTDRFTLCENTIDRSTPIWKWIDLEPKASKASSSSLDDLIDTTHIHLPFSVRYQLEVCMSHGYLPEFNLAREFALELAELEEKQARKLLEHVAIQKKIYYNPMEIFDLKFIKGATTGKIPSYCCYMRSARITPSTVYYNVPTVDISNRVIRHYINLADNFIRVRFTDEKHMGRINSTADNTMDEVFTRIKRALANGITIGSTRYEFLAFGNSQFREHGAYFFAPKDGVTAASIRAWMGQFSHIRNIAKHAARLGQCFSTTRAISGCSAHVRRIDDIERNGYTFSDGVGKISKFLAQIAMSELKIKTPTREPPSGFQFRLGGCKGMLIVSPDAHRQEVHIRKSQFKFAALSQGLEIIRWSQFSIATLNRQLILVLSTLEIPDDVFHLKLKNMLKNLDDAMESDPKAVYLLRKYVDPNQITLTLSQMVLDGFRRSNEPFVTSILALWRAWHLKYLKEKAKIVIDEGANLLGCMDETATLKGHFYHKVPKKDASIEEKTAALPEIFVQVYRPEDGGKYKIIEGLCILARNPSLHPGDIRVVRAVDVPALHHLKDVVVLPQTGDRDVASMCSGGDLDGDDYLVIWDQDLISGDWFRDPMKYTSNKAQDHDQDVTVDEITSFFVMYMKNDCLPTIALAHLAWGDYLQDGVDENKCIQLAQLHSDAVDYNKTGNPAVMTRALRPRRWPHFMERTYKPEHTIYHSQKVLGQLYDAVERVDFAPNLEMNFDTRILDCQIEVPDEMHDYAKSLKDEYDTAIRRIMAQHEIKTEFEVWSTFVLSHSNMSKDYKFHEEIGAISSALREDFKKRAQEKVGGRTFELLAPLVVAMYRITHSEMTEALAKHRQENPPDERPFNSVPAPKIEHLPLISFPWVFSKILGQIAVGHYEHPDTIATLSADQSLNRSDDRKAEEAIEKTSSGTDQAQKDLGHGKHHDQDPFGLNLHDDTEGITIASSQALPSHGDNSSLEQLLDFGPLDIASTPSPSTGFPLSSVHEGNLLDFDRDPDEGGWTANPKKAVPDTQPVPEAENKHANAVQEPLVPRPKSDLKENQPLNEQMGEQEGEQIRVVQTAKGKQGHIIEIIEESEDEDGDDPLGIDKLSELAGF